MLVKFIKNYFKRKIILGFMAGVMLQVAVLPNLSIVASASAIEEVLPIATIEVLEKAFIFDEKNNEYIFDENILRESGFSDNEIEEFKYSFEEVESINSNARGYDWISAKYGKKALSLPVWILTIVSYLQYKVADSIISRLIDWCLNGVSYGYNKFCNNYGNANWATKAVCLK